MHDKDALFYLYRADPKGSRYNALTDPTVAATAPNITDYILVSVLHRSLDCAVTDIIAELYVNPAVDAPDYRPDRSDVIAREVDGQITAFWVDGINQPDNLRVLSDFFCVPHEHRTAYDQGYSQAIKDLNTPRSVVIPGQYDHTICPQCGKDFSSVEDNFDGVPDRATGMLRCPYCGQRLDWENYTSQVNPYKT